MCVEFLRNPTMRKVVMKAAPLLWNGFKHQTFGFKLSGVEIEKYTPLICGLIRNLLALKN